MALKSGLGAPHFIIFFATFSESRFIYAPRIPADLLKRSVWLRSATKLSRRPCLVSTRCRSLGPKGTQGPLPHPKKTPQGPPQGQGKGRGARGPRALGAVGRDGPMGPFGVIPKPFRMVSYSEASPNGKAVPNGWLFRMESYALCSNSRENAEPNVGGSGWILMDLNGFGWIIEIYMDFVD